MFFIVIPDVTEWRSGIQDNTLVSVVMEWLIVRRIYS
jgi:hypothetical protein